MRKFTIKIGRPLSVILITITSIILSLIITHTIVWLTGSAVDQATNIAAIVAPTAIAPGISWYFIGLLIKIHHLEEEQRKLATFDHLTGAMTRRSFLENSNTLLNQSSRNKQDLTIAILDIDNFKSINDRYGHTGGDEVLRSFSMLLQNMTRSCDLTGRLGGEEFAITMLGVDTESALLILERIRAAIETETIEHGTEKISYTVSIGVSQSDSTHADTIDDVIMRADKALYEAKSEGKNRTRANVLTPD